MRPSPECPQPKCKSTATCSNGRANRKAAGQREGPERALGGAPQAALPGSYRAPARLESVKERWRDALSKIRRLRNRVAHHRNIEFQDMEDLAGCIENMRRELYNYGAWR